MPKVIAVAIYALAHVKLLPASDIDKETFEISHKMGSFIWYPNRVLTMS